MTFQHRKGIRKNGGISYNQDEMYRVIEKGPTARDWYNA